MPCCEYMVNEAKLRQICELNFHELKKVLGSLASTRDRLFPRINCLFTPIADAKSRL